MKNNGLGFMLLCCSILLSGCSNNGLNDKSSFEAVGVYRIEGYSPSEKDISEIPYSYHGQGNYFSVVCDVRALNTDERQFAISSKEQELLQIQQLKTDYPERSADYERMIEKVQSEITAIKSADVLYITELFAEYIGSDNMDEAKGRVRYSISKEDAVYLSGESVIKSNLWVSLKNTANGNYSEGILLPYKDSYEITIEYEDKVDTFPLRLTKEQIKTIS